jgi:hypothetical protein
MAKAQNLKMSDAPADRPRRNWLTLVLTTLIGVAATVGVGWYQLYRAEKEAVLAEQERARVVRQSLVSIVEEHVLNDKPIALGQLARLIDQRRRDERVNTIITLSEVLEQVEFNILNTRYLSFERKEALKPVFQTLYSELGTRAFAAYPPEARNADLLNELARHIQEGKSEDALETLKRLQEAHVKDLEAGAPDRHAPSPSEFLREIAKNPWPFILLAAAYLGLTWMLINRRQALRRALHALLTGRGEPETPERMLEKLEEAQAMVQGLSPEAKAFAVEVSRRHIPKQVYDKLAAGPYAKTLQELRTAGVLTSVRSADGSSAHYFPHHLARPLRAVTAQVTVPAAAREAVEAELERVGYNDARHT